MLNLMLNGRNNQEQVENEDTGRKLGQIQEHVKLTGVELQDHIKIQDRVKTGGRVANSVVCVCVCVCVCGGGVRLRLKGRPHWRVYFHVKHIVFAHQKMFGEMFFPWQSQWQP